MSAIDFNVKITKVARKLFVLSLPHWLWQSFRGFWKFNNMCHTLYRNDWLAKEQLSAVLKHKFMKKSMGNSHVKIERQVYWIYLRSDGGNKSGSLAGLVFLLLTALKDNGGSQPEVAGPAWNKTGRDFTKRPQEGAWLCVSKLPLFYQTCYTLWRAS